MGFTGAKSEDVSMVASRKYVGIIQKLGFNATFSAFEDQNLSYEPALIPGLFEHVSKDLRCTVFLSLDGFVALRPRTDRISSIFGPFVLAVSGALDVKNIVTNIFKVPKPNVFTLFSEDAENALWKPFHPKNHHITPDVPSVVYNYGHRCDSSMSRLTNKLENVMSAMRCHSRVEETGMSSLFRSMSTGAGGILATMEDIVSV
ncbi:hypothetical protein JAAARDRAFT_192949 [Jaapia argillacea MUCL 33604]|uniref:Uncharacterized protein n=1 Tax=Jaapia argillacea MUCL 33604 TaxID=933084 RepID=A0A067Q4E2_9AGAM|nr:hypothetical protein JAAARDRAFT_192949 [Jaapia argillacea MUCL 33604]